MLSRRQKALFYAFASPMMRISGTAYRRFGAPREGQIRVHLGPGQTKYLPSWINVDANMFTGKCDVWADLRNPLPFRPGTVKAMYSHHVVEHLPDLRLHFKEAMRCLSPGGIYRVAGPNGDAAIRKFVDEDLAWFTDWPDERRSIGGRLDNFIFCRAEHVTILTRSFLTELMEEVGFTNIAARLPVRDTGYPELFDDAMRTEAEDDYDWPHTLILEGEKPSPSSVLLR